MCSAKCLQMQSLFNQNEAMSFSITLYKTLHESAVNLSILDVSVLKLCETNDKQSDYQCKCQEVPDSDNHSLNAVRCTRTAFCIWQHTIKMYIRVYVH